MELSQFTDYALRVLIYVGLSEQKSDSPLPLAAKAAPSSHLPSVREIAGAFQISQSHLVKVVQRLAQLGYIHTFRGRGGGITLAKAPSEIGVGAIVRQTENLAIVECLSTSGGCCIAPVCELKGVIARAREAFLASLDASTLADLLKPHNALQRILHAAPAAQATPSPATEIANAN